ncbi:MAG: hypothetical protein ACI4ST_08020, partial [Candidatus Gallimonas sp.]
MIRQKLTDLHDDTYPAIRRCLLPALTVIYVGFFLFLYLSRVTIDEGTPAMYAALDTIFYV